MEEQDMLKAEAIMRLVWEHDENIDWGTDERATHKKESDAR